MSISRRELLLTSGAVLMAASVGSPTAGSAVEADNPGGSERKYKSVSEKIFIPMRDGVKLGAVLVRPDAPDGGVKYPALFTYDPYRATDSDGLSQMAYYAEHGYYGAHVDLRGTGMSQGQTVPNEYSEQEGRDADDAIAWLAAQPWCNGNVGMFGTSYGGFNSIQIAMRNPPALKAIIPTFATDDVYTDDIVYYDGALQCDSLGRWPFSMIASSGLPGPPDFDPETPEAKYRVEQEPWIFEMLRHQTDDPFWQRMSLRPNYGAIKIPTLMVAGWLDAYTDSFPRMLEKMSAPRKAIVGPWTHGIGLPGPAINIQHEHVRWWDHWLKGLNTGMMDEPRIAMYVMHSYLPSLNIREVPGAWRYEDSWPVARVKSATFFPQPDGLLARTKKSDLRSDLTYKPTVGMTNRYRCPHNSAELPVDQRPDDDYSMCFDSAKLEEDMEILGHPSAVLYVSSTQPVANWIVRLCDIAPDGTSSLVTKGILNGTHHESHVAPRALVPGQIYKLELNLKVISWVFPKGHRIRFAICNADFPNLWPSPYPMTTSLYLGKDHPSQFVLPVCPSVRRPVPRFQAPEKPAGSGYSEPENKWTVTRDEMARTVTVFRETASNRAQNFERRWTTVSDDNPANARIVAEGQAQVLRGSDTVTCKTNMTIESDEKMIYISAKRELFVNDKVKYIKSWTDTIPRNLV